MLVPVGWLDSELVEDRVFCQPLGPPFTALANSGFICITLAASAGLGVKGDQGSGGVQNSGWEAGWNCLMGSVRALVSEGTQRR